MRILCQACPAQDVSGRPERKVVSWVWHCREQELEELMQKLRVAEQEREQLARHNTLLERAIIARDRVSADFSEASAYGLEEPKVCRNCLPSRFARDWRSPRRTMAAPPPVVHEL